MYYPEIINNSNSNIKWNFHIYDLSSVNIWNTRDLTLFHKGFDTLHEFILPFVLMSMFYELGNGLYI